MAHAKLKYGAKMCFSKVLFCRMFFFFFGESEFKTRARVNSTSENIAQMCKSAKCVISKQLVTGKLVVILSRFHINHKS